MSNLPAELGAACDHLRQMQGPWDADASMDAALVRASPAGRLVAAFGPASDPETRRRLAWLALFAPDGHCPAGNSTATGLNRPRRWPQSASGSSSPSHRAPGRRSPSPRRRRIVGESSGIAALRIRVLRRKLRQRRRDSSRPATRWTSRTPSPRRIVHSMSRPSATTTISGNGCSPLPYRPRSRVAHCHPVNRKRCVTTMRLMFRACGSNERLTRAQGCCIDWSTGSCRRGTATLEPSALSQHR